MSKPTYSIDAPDQGRLKVARLEIEALLKKHDLAGVVVLHTPGMSEFFYDVRPSYSCMWIDDVASAVRVKSLAADYGGDRQAQLHDQAATANMAAAMADNLLQAAKMFAHVQRFVDHATRAEHTPRGFVPDQAEGKRQ